MRKAIKNLQRIVRATNDEVSEKDLESDAWVAAVELGTKRGRQIDFADPADQALLLGALNIRNVKRQEKNVRYGVRIDAEETDDEENQNPWHNRLRAQETADPQVWLISEEERLEREKRFMQAFDNLLGTSYSEHAAYVAMLYNFEADRASLCAYLVITQGTLSARMSTARQKADIQPSVFDGIERIDRAFMPLRGRRYPTREEPAGAGVQFSWEFA